MKSISIIFLFLLSTITYSSELVDIIRLDNDVTLLRFTEQFEYSTSLSDDKKNLTIDLLSVSNSFNKSSIKLRSDIQKEIFVSNDNGNIKLNLILNRPSGFNTYKLPYSNSLIIENFDWSKIDKSEESYRDGLFAYESMLYDIAIEHLNNSDSHGKGMLGLIYLFQDSVDSSYKLLVDAARNNNYLPDIYAALSQIHLQNGDTTKSNYFNQRFLEKLNINDSTFEYPKLIFNSDGLDINSIAEVIDSSDAKIKSKSKNENRFSNLFDTASSKSNKDFESGNNFNIGSNTSEIKSYFVYVIIAFILVLLLIVAYYLRWRNMKLNKQKEIARSSFEDELKKESNTNKPSPIVYDKTIGTTRRSSIKDIKQTQQKNNKHTNFKLNDIEEKIRYKDSIKNISVEKDSNINLDTIKDMNESSKSKLFRKYFVNNK
ncbi:MAG: hypothetical protein ACE364_01290 [Chlorobiota bacterium]